MIYDELIEQMRSRASWLEFATIAKPSKTDGNGDAILFRKAADAIEELSHPQIAPEKIIQTMWIPVTERLPRENGKYLTVFTVNSIPPRPVIEVSGYAKDLYKIDKYDFHDKKRKHGFYQYDGEWGYFEMPDISHWMPLPQPPESEDE